MLARSSLLVLSLLTASVCAAAAMTALRLPTEFTPLVLALFVVAGMVGFRRLPLVDAEPLRWFEGALIGWAAAIQLVRLVPYTAQHLTGGLGAAVNYDDNWHFQELASLVNSERFPPLLNYQPDTHLHFYYVAWMPAAAIGELFQLAGASAIKFSYGAGTLLLGIAAAVILVVVLRHLLEPRQRGPALAAVLVAGAVPDGVVVLGRWVGALATPSEDWLAHAEWWQRDLGIPNQISSLTTLLIWVPHHLIAAMALLLAVVVATEPRTLAPRTGPIAMVAAGLLVGFAAFSSVFALIGGLATLSPLLARFVTRPGVVVAVLATAFVSAPLAYIYLNADSAGGFRFFLIFTRWSEQFGGTPAGLAGLALAAAFVMAEVGWLAWLALRPPPSPLASPLGQCAIAASLFLAATVVIGFSGANNFAMRGAILPVIVIAMAWSRARVAAAPDDGPEIVRPLAAAVLVLFAGATHLNEALLHGRNAGQAIAFVQETETCKASIMAANAGPPGPVDPTGWDCRHTYSLYGLERPFVKRTLTDPDYELMGRGP
ncbi:hypothetical protein [Rhodoplanes roseus]|uniref:Glycosyltransferase RgtA/B/C/D-like domain-containing protein n=1 Tax=Rhodoplanes roseus TaxID=29409 RepID=A0A327KZ98_9BRAD|nr:hypothetical protein [Rhodoplanes roseus]RAI43486.1 hypothetical protein CH341_14085 [Rhodoplanes roseus]